MCAGQDTGQKPDAHWMPRLSRRWFLLRRRQAQWTVPSRILPLLPALRTLSSEKMGDSRRFFVFKMLTRTRRAVAGQSLGVENFSS
jgi:hypothetical protein